MRFLRSSGELGSPREHPGSDVTRPVTVTGGWVERLWFGAQVGHSSEPLPMRVFLRRSGVNVPCETTAMPSLRIAAADANGPESQACPLPHIGRLGPDQAFDAAADVASTGAAMGAGHRPTVRMQDSGSEPPSGHGHEA